MGSLKLEVTFDPESDEYSSRLPVLHRRHRGKNSVKPFQPVQVYVFKVGKEIILV
jgi:hypothetical protein